MSSDANDDDPPYDVGYGRPPKKSRVVKGQVLNPRGRPRGSKNRKQPPSRQELSEIILAEAHRTIPVADANGKDLMSMAQAVIRSTLVLAAKGNTRAQRLAADLIRTAELETKHQREHDFAVALDYKLAWNRELARRKVLGIKGPAPLPHPDHVVLDLAKGVVHIKGPATAEEKVAWARWESYRGMFEADLRELQAEQQDLGCKDHTGLAKRIEHARYVLRVIGFALEGNRDAMALLEGVFADFASTQPDLFSEPHES
jgi:Family of unknown function (DUF5681)